MPTDTTDAVLGGLLGHQLDTWLTGALRRSRRVTLALAYTGPAGDSADQLLRAVATTAHRVRGRRLTVVVLADDPELPGRLGPRTASLPAEVTVHLVPGHTDRLPVVLKAAGGAGAPIFTVLVDPTGDVLAGPAGRALLTAASSGRPADLLLAAPGPADLHDTLTTAGFPLVTAVETTTAPDAAPRCFALGTSSDRNLEAFKDGLWHCGAASGLHYRSTDGHPEELAAEPDPTGLAGLLHVELLRSGPRTVTELRRHTLTATPYRAADALRALTVLVDTGRAHRTPADGRLAGDVVIDAVNT